MNDRPTNGAEWICDSLVEEGVRILFGHPGGAILPFYDALHGRPELRHVLVRHEQAAAHAADGYARATGNVGVCLATSGPGATNLVTGLATAAMDSVPLVALTGQVPTNVMGTDAFQEVDVLGLTIPVTKHGFLVESFEDIPDVMREAFRVARSGRPGPVLVDLPKNVQAAAVPAYWRNRPASVPPSENGTRPAPTDPRLYEVLGQAAELLDNALRPVIMVGRGVVASETSECVRALAEAHRLPVITTLLGLDAFSRNHPLSLGMPGMHGTARANRAIQEADLILGFGLRFDDRVTGPVASFAPAAQIVLFEVDPAVVGRTVKPDLAVVGDLRTTLPAFRGRTRSRAHRGEEWWGRLRTWSRDPSSTVFDAAGEGSPFGGLEDQPPTGREAARALARQIEGAGGQVSTDVGQHQMWMAQELKEGAPATHFTSGGLGTMGYALPAAIGAAFGRADRATWAVAGDGGFQMTLQEMATVVQEDLPVRIVVVNNGYLGMVRQWQELFFEGRYSASRLSGPDMSAVARAYGIPARTVTRRDELTSALRWADAATGPVFLEIRVVNEENVYPLVPPGARLDEMVEEPIPPAPEPATLP